MYSWFVFIFKSCQHTINQKLKYNEGDAKYAITASDGSQAQVTQDDIGIVSHQAGVNVGKTIKTAGGMNVHPSVGVGYRHTNSEATVAINDHALTQKFANEVQTQVGIGIGKGDWELNLQADYAKNNESGSRTSALMGVNWRW